MSFESWTQSGAEISLHGAFEAGHAEADAQIAALQLERDALREALVKLLDKLDAIAETANGIYAFAYVHGMEYQGPNWSLEYEAGRKLLSIEINK